MIRYRLLAMVLTNCSCLFLYHSSSSLLATSRISFIFFSSSASLSAIRCFCSSRHFFMVSGSLINLSVFAMDAYGSFYRRRLEYILTYISTLLLFPRLLLYRRDGLDLGVEAGVGFGLVEEISVAVVLDFGQFGLLARQKLGRRVALGRRP